MTGEREEAHKVGFSLDSQTFVRSEGTERGPLLLTWQVHLLTQGSARVVVLVTVILALLPLLYIVLGHLAGALLLWGAVLLSLSPALLPTTYALYEGGAFVRQGLRSMFRPWDYFVRYEVDEAGVFLSPFDAPRRLETFRGMYLRAADNKVTILEIVRAHLDMEKPGEIWYTRDAVRKAKENGTIERGTQG